MAIVSLKRSTTSKAWKMSEWAFGRFFVSPPKLSAVNAGVSAA